MNVLPLPLVEAASATLEKLGYGCFADSGAVGTFVVGAALKSLGTSILRNTKLAAIVAPFTNTSLPGIPVGSFAECKALTSVDLSGCAAVASLSDRSFENCTALTAFFPPPALKSIGVAAFAGAVALKRVNFAGCAEFIAIGRGAFVGCAALVEVRATDSAKLKDVQHSAFGQCGALTRVAVHAAVGPVLSGKTMITMIAPDALWWDGMPPAATTAAAKPRNAWGRPLVK